MYFLEYFLSLVSRLYFLQTRTSIISMKSLKSLSFYLPLLTCMIIDCVNNQMDRIMKWSSNGHQSNQSSHSSLTFSRKHHLLLWSSISPSWYPSMRPEEEGRLVGGVGLEGEGAWEGGSTGQHLLHWWVRDPAHVHDGGGCSQQRTSRDQGACKTLDTHFSCMRVKQLFNI